MIRNFLLLISLFFVHNVQGQETWSLQRCIEYAQSHSRNIKNAQISIKNAELTTQQAQDSRYPSASFGANYGYNFGRSVNPSTYTFENRTTNYNNLQLSAQATLYNGNRINNQIRQGNTDTEAAKADAQQAAQTLALNVAQAYLQILLNEEQLDNARKRLQGTKDQLQRTEKQIAAGSLPQNARFDFLAQIAKAEQNEVTADNNVTIAYLNLRQLLELGDETVLKVEKPTLSLINDFSENTVISENVNYTNVLNTQPQVRAGELRLKSAEIGVAVAKAGYLPILGIQGNLSTNYSNSILDFTKGTSTIQSVTQPVQINGENKQLTLFQPTVTDVPKKAYGSQIGDNFGQGVGLNLQVPIFQNNRNRIAVERAKLSVETQRLNNERIAQQLRSDLQNAIAAAKNAQKSYAAAQRSVEAQKAAFENTEKRFQAGASNSFEYTSARINYDTAQTDVTVAKFELLFRLKILDFYQGKSLF